MTVDEIIALLPQLSPDELIELHAAIAADERVAINDICWEY